MDSTAYRQQNPGIQLGQFHNLPLKQFLKAQPKPDLHWSFQVMQSNYVANMILSVSPLIPASSSIPKPHTEGGL